MKEDLIAALVFLAAAIYVILFEQFAGSTRLIQKAIVLPIILFLIGILFFFSHASFKKLINNQGRWLFLFLCTIFIQLLVIATGGIKSPLFILIYLFMVGISLFFSFTISLFFLLSCLIVITSTLILNDSLIPLLMTNPTPLILQLASFIPIVAICYIVSKHYHLKDISFKKLNTKVITQEAILANLTELIIITDAKLNILSLNDAAARAVQRSRSELMDTPIFATFLLKDHQGNLLTKKTFTPEKFTGAYTLVSSLAQRDVTLHVQPTNNLNEIEQISFIISYPMQTSVDKLAINFEKTRTKYEAMIETLKKMLIAQGNEDASKQILLLQKIENDISETRTIQNQSNPSLGRIDLAQLTMQATRLEQEFANAFHVSLNFVLKNFGQKDIQPLLTNNFTIKPEDFTGPFFTVTSDFKQLEFVIKKLLDLGILLASTEKNPVVTISIERENNTTLQIQMIVTSPPLTDQDLTSLFLPYYGNLSTMPNLRIGSGLEGYLIKNLCEQLKISLDTHYESALTFTLHVPKSPNIKI